MRGCLLLQFLHQKRPFQSHSHNSLFRSMNFDNKHVIFRLDIIDLAFQVLAFGSVAGFFSSCVWRMMAPRFLPSAQARINKGNQRHQGEDGDGEGGIWELPQSLDALAMEQPWVCVK